MKLSRRNFLACGAAAAALSRAQTGRAEPACANALQDQDFDVTQPPNIDFVKARLRHYHCARYDADVRAVLAEASDWVGARAPQVKRPALVFDIDETSLSNWERIDKDDFGYIPNGACDLSQAGQACGDLDWQKSGKAPAIAPTLGLFNQAAKTGAIPVFFITGRYEGAEARGWTEANLSKAGYGGWARLYMRDPASRSQPSVSIHKTAARADIERQGFVIIANIGDQLSDLAGGHAERTFKVPNPFYFIR